MLDVKLEEIYEPEDGVYFIYNQNESVSGNYSGSNNFFDGMTEYTFETMRKYIEKLEAENNELQSKIDFLESKK